MVTIDPEKSVLNIADLKQTSNRANPSAVKFDNVFKSLIDPEEEVNTAAEPAAYMADIRPAQFSAPIQPSQTLLVDRVQDLIDALDVYQQKLNDPNTTLKEIDPYLEKLAAQAASLEKQVDSASADGELGAIINQSLNIASVELARYRSGQYINE